MKDLPYNLDMYKADLQRMMRNPMATGQPEAAGTTQADPFARLRVAAQNIAATATAGSAMPGSPV